MTLFRINRVFLKLSTRLIQFNINVKMNVKSFNLVCIKQHIVSTCICDIRFLNFNIFKIMFALQNTTNWLNIKSKHFYFNFS